MGMTYAIDGIVFKWEGGEYIDVFNGDADAPFHALNVWDYETSRPTINSISEFYAECEAYLSDEDDEEYDDDYDVDWEDESHPDDFEIDSYSEDLANEWR